MPSGCRMPTWRERENNKRRERRRRAIAAKIFAGLRLYGNYRLPKHCDNNEVLKALCHEAGWTVEPDGTTYRKGCKPVEKSMDFIGCSILPSPCSSYQPSPCTSYNPSPSSSSFHSSPASSSYHHAPPNYNVNLEGNSSLIPWLKNLSSSSSSKFPHYYFHGGGGSISAPITPPTSSPTSRTPTRYNYYSNFVPSPSLIHSPTHSLLSHNPTGSTARPFRPRVSTPGQMSRTCSPVVVTCSDVPMGDVVRDESVFGTTMGLVKPWEGERIHEECGPDELELTLGSSKTR
ncbi:unnamed protein product [Cuscuta campestris]|uniref:Protein BZR1 homolog n=1 Tax=Cuscuta campestris TaxID=132261 RepID=A0A484N937_9ASTE|nr:unnamed protein product [Cuscuta campestris]